MPMRIASRGLLLLAPLVLSGCLVIGPCGQLCFLPLDIFDAGTEFARIPSFDVCEICVDGGCGGGALSCFRDGTTSCGCSAGPSETSGQSRLVSEPYGPPSSVSFDILNAAAGATSSHRLTLSLPLDHLQTYRGVITYPTGFDFPGFTARGGPGSQFGTYAMDIGATGRIHFEIPLIAIDADNGYADLERNGTQDAIDPTIVRTDGSHIFTVTMPFGGDGIATRLLGPIPLRVIISLFAGVLTNPTTPGDYPVSGVFTSVDPESGDDDDTSGESPQSFSGGEADQLVSIGPSPIANVDHYLCYKAAQTRGKLCRVGSSGQVGQQCDDEEDCSGSTGATDFCAKNKLAKGFKLSLDDELGDADQELKKQTNFCLPAEKNDEGGPIDPSIHLREYTLKKLKKLCRSGSDRGRECAEDSDCTGGSCERPQRFSKVRVRVDNQLGSLPVQLTKLESVLVPSTKGLGAPTQPPGPTLVDHYQCYKAKEQKKRCAESVEQKCKRDSDCGINGPCIQRFPKGLMISLEDQFIDPPGKLFEVKKPARLCIAADKNQEGVTNSTAGLMCYRVKPVRGEPKHAKRKGVFVANQIGRERLDTKGEREVCIPSQFLRASGS